MLCFEEITLEFIFLHTPKVFRDQYFTKVSERVLIEETLLINATKEKLYMEKKVKMLYSRINAFENHLKKYPDDTLFQTLLNETNTELIECRQVINSSEKIVLKTSKTIVCPIPSCEGIVVKGICNVCVTNICNICFMVKMHNYKSLETPGDSHICDVDVLETLKLLMKDTKNCPKCQVPIHKTEGCDQMFCVSCHTAFSWRTGKIESGVVHNPHYFQWMREQGGGEIPRQPGDDPCEDVLRGAVTKFNGSLRKIQNEYCKTLIREYFIDRILRELSTVIRRMSTALFDNNVMDDKKRKLRIQYIQNKGKFAKLNKEEKKKAWAWSLRTMLKKQELEKECYHLLQTFERAFKDALIKSLDEDYDEFEKTVVSLQEYFSEQTRDIKRRHGLCPRMYINIRTGLNSPWLT
jgi:hypothetical protein